jgi:hypothetical protein
MNDCDITSEDTDELVRLSLFVEMGKAIAGAKTMDETLTRTMEHIGAVFRPEHWSVLLKDPDTGELTFALVIGTNASKLQGMRLPPGEA